MRRIITVLSIVATSVLLSAASVISAETGIVNEGRDECLLVATNCADNVDSIQQRIERLNKEIAKGTAVYTEDELSKLNMKLENTIKQLEELTTGS